MQPMTILRHELDTYEAHKEELLGRAKGMYVLIKGDRILDVFASQEDAVRRGYEELGNVPFLVKQVLEVELPLNFTTHVVAP